MNQKSHTNPQSKDTSWNTVAPWYNQIVGSQGHYYHTHVVLPNLVRLLKLGASDSLVDLGCGQGVLTEYVPKSCRYLGIDASKQLINLAQKKYHGNQVRFHVADLCHIVSPPELQFSHACFLLSLQNLRYPEKALDNAATYLKSQGKLVLVLNHPCFRIPRQSGWGIDPQNKQQYRWINRYASPLEIPITMNPGKGGTQTTWSFHHSLADYSKMLRNSGFVITQIEEWQSDKSSEGKAAKMENRARSEFPLFMAIVAEKLR